GEGGLGRGGPTLAQERCARAAPPGRGHAASDGRRLAAIAAYGAAERIDVEALCLVDRTGTQFVVAQLGGVAGQRFGRLVHRHPSQDLSVSPLPPPSVLSLAGSTPPRQSVKTVAGQRSNLRDPQGR